MPLTYLRIGFCRYINGRLNEYIMRAEATSNHLGNSILNLQEQIRLLRKHVDTLVNNPVFDGLSAVTRDVKHAANECKESFEDYILLNSNSL